MDILYIIENYTFNMFIAYDTYFIYIRKPDPFVDPKRDHTFFTKTFMFIAL